MAEFKPRAISMEMAAQGYNNQGRGKLIGYIAVPRDHEETCRYRISTGGNPDKNPHESCTCLIGLWQEESSAMAVLNTVRKTAKRIKKAPKPKKAAKPKAKASKKRKAK